MWEVGRIFAGLAGGVKKGNGGLKKGWSHLLNGK
jgi:hypothetical protein